MHPDETCLGCAAVMRERDAASVLGISRRKAQTLLADGVLQRIRRGVVVGGCVSEQARSDPSLAHAISLRSLLLTHDDAAASHESGASLLGLPTLERPRLAIATRAQGAWRGGQTSRVRIAPLPGHHVTVAQGMRCTTAPRTVVDISRSSSLRHAVVVGDAALRTRCSRDALRGVFDECAAWFDLGRARVALDFFDPRSESALESVSRVIIHERELPPPTPQVEITADDRTGYRVDFFWEAQRVIGEADGLAKYDVSGALRAEKIRQERLERLGFKIVRWTWREILVDTDETIARLRSALLR